MNIFAHPFEHSRLIGAVTHVDASGVEINLPKALSTGDDWSYGERHGLGRVGEFIIIESEEYGIIGRVTSVHLPETDRSKAEDRLGQKTANSLPTGRARLLTTLSLSESKIVVGIPRYPRIGSKVYSLRSEILRLILENNKTTRDGEELLTLTLAEVGEDRKAKLQVTPEKLFGRHCAILGTSGGGKSWTLARMLQECAGMSSKVILLDATGEYYPLDCSIHVAIGTKNDLPKSCTHVRVPYTDLDDSDIMSLFKPSPLVQLPKLREALRSLKLAKILGNMNEKDKLVRDGLIPKAGKERAPFNEMTTLHASMLYERGREWSIKLLTNQIEHECVSQTPYNQPDSPNWGGPYGNDVGHCSTLITRIVAYTRSPEFACLFEQDTLPGLFQQIDEFLKGDATTLRISLKYLSFTSELREIVCNVIGRYLLEKARNGAFTSKPLVVFVDEAHQFLSKKVGEDGAKFALDAFELIAKEGRKYNLSLTLATQRPRDIPEGVLSQMGTLLVHRLTNDRDRDLVEKSCGDLDRSTMSFLPTLSEGEAIIVGVDFPIPLPIKICPPEPPPDSKGPDFQTLWAIEPPANKELLKSKDIVQPNPPILEDPSKVGVFTES